MHGSIGNNYELTTRPYLFKDNIVYANRLKTLPSAHNN